MTNFADKLQNRSTAVRVRITWLRLSCAVDRNTVQAFADTQAAQADSLRATKTIIDRKHPIVKALTATRNEIQAYWHGMSLPYVENGVRLINRDTLAEFTERMNEFKTQLAEQGDALAAEFDSIIATARESLGSMFDANDYPRNVAESISLSWDFPSISPPNYLRQLDPELYAAEQSKVQRRFEEAVEMAETMFATDFAKLVEDLSSRLTDDNARFPQRKLDQIKAFMDRFRTLSVGSSSQLDALVSDLDKLSSGVDKLNVKDDAYRESLVKKLDTMGNDLGELIEKRPTRRLRLND